MKPTKILFIHHAVGWGGAPNSMIKIINALDKTKYEPFVLLIRDSVVSTKLKENGIPYLVAKSFFYRSIYKYYSHTIPNHIKWFNFFSITIRAIYWILSKYFFAERELNKIDFQIAHLNSSVLTDWLAPCKKYGKVVLHIREPLYNGIFGIRLRLLQSQMRKYCDQVITISKDNAKRIDLDFKTSVVYNFTKLSENNILSTSYYSKKVLYVGGYAKIKGFPTIVKALKYVNEDVKIIFVGYFPKNRKKLFIDLLSNKYIIRKLINEMHKSNRAIVKGFVDDIGDVLNEVCCLISPHSVEHFSRPIIEAFAYHKPVIATKIEGIDEIIEDRVDGILIKKNNPKELAQAINSLANEPELLITMGNKGYHKAKNLFSPNNINSIEEIYNSLIMSK